MLTGNHTKKGFGNLKGGFWLRNDYIHRLTESVNMMVRIDTEDYEGDRGSAEYTTFSVADESDDYRVTIDEYQGTSGDALLSLSRPIRYVTGILVLVLCRMNHIMLISVKSLQKNNEIY